MTVVAPISAPAGTTVCMTVTGVVGTLHATALVAGQARSVTLTSRPGGVVLACVTLPPGVVGSLTIDFTDGSGLPFSESVIIG